VTAGDAEVTLLTPAPLTGRLCRRASAQRLGWQTPSSPTPRQPGPVPHACLGCGGPVLPTRLRCPDCARTRREELTTRARGHWAEPAEQVPPAPAVRITPNRLQLAACLGLDPETTHQRLQQLGRRRLAELTGASPVTTARWLTSDMVPQRRWWEPLRKAISP
jgi:hypothetical protein